MNPIDPTLLSLYQKFEKLRSEQIQAGTHDYCLLTAVLPANNEERLHSRFIYSMINPTGLHYKGNLFLKHFLQQLPHPLNTFINLDQAVVAREKGCIDLLIHDGIRYLIIENKLNAIDQNHQITRYIKYVQDSYLNNEDSLSDHIAVVYLSKNRSKPTKSSNSLIGFELKGQEIEWQGLPEEQTNNSQLKGIRLAQGQSLPFVHMGYFPAIENWAKQCLEIAPNGIDNAFQDYLRVLDRIHPKRVWRKIVTLDQYTLSLSEEKQKQIYAFMVEANNNLINFVALKLYEELKKLFNVDELIAFENLYSPLTLDSLKRWLAKGPGNKSEWRDIACITSEDTYPRKGLLLGVDYAYLSEITEDGKILTSKESRIRYGKVRNILNQKEGLYRFVDELQKALAR